MSQKPRHSYPTESSSLSSDQPRLYQPQPRRIPLPSPDSQLPPSPRHQNPELYSHHLPPDRFSQQTMPCPPPHPPRSHPQSTPSVPLTHEETHFNSTRSYEQHHPSIQVLPHRPSSHSLEPNNQSQPPPQSRIQSLYIHNPPKFQHSSDYSTHDPSVSRRHEHFPKERSQQSTLSNPSESPSQSKFQEDRLHYLPENIMVQNQAYHPRESLPSPMSVQSHPPYPSPTQRQHLQLHYEQQQDSRHRQAASRQNESPPLRHINSTPHNIEKIASSQDPQSHHRLGAHPPSQEPLDRKIINKVQYNPPVQQSKSSKFDSVDGSSRAEKPYVWRTQKSIAPQPPTKILDASKSYQLEMTRDKSPKASDASQPEQSRPQVVQGPSPVDHTSPVSQARFSADLSQPKATLCHRTPSPHSNRTSYQVEKDSTSHQPSPGSSRPPPPNPTTTDNRDREISAAPSCTEEEVLDEGADDGVIRCICSITTDDGFTIQCEICEVWQHAVCVNVPIDEVPEHYFCDQCDPLPERRRQLMEMAPQAERIQRQRLRKEAEVRTDKQVAHRPPLVTHGSPHVLKHPGPEEQDGSFIDSPAASTSMSRVSSGVCVTETVGFEAPAQSPNGNLKGKRKANSSGNLDKMQATLYTDNGLGLSGLQESPTLVTNPRVEDSSLTKDPAPRKPGRKPTKFNQSKSSFSKTALDPLISSASASNVVESENILVQNSADTDDRYEAWRYEYTPTLKDLYLDTDVKCQVQNLIRQYFRSLCEDGNLNDLDSAEIPVPETDHTEKPVLLPSKLASKLSECGKSPVPPLAQPISPPLHNTDSTTKPQRAAPHAFGNTQFLPVTMTELPPPLKLTIKAIPPSAINFFPSLTTNPFCPNFSNSLNNSSTSSLPRLITHGVFSAQPISRGSYIACLKGSITSVRKYAQDVFSQYDTLGCNKPYVKFFKSTRLANYLCDKESGQIDDGLVIDSRQYGNEMRFIRNGCHPNAFINLIMTPQAPCLQNSELPKGAHRSHLLSTEESNTLKSFANSSRDPWPVSGSLIDRDLHLPWEVSFGVFAASDISRREEIILPWDWDDQHLVHLLPRLLNHSSAFEIQQQQRSPTLPPVRSQFLPWSMGDLKLLSRKLAAVTLTLFGLMFCGCERKKSCAINLMWKVGCLSAGEPMFPNVQDASVDQQKTAEILPISVLKERQEMNLPLTFEEKFRLVLHFFLEQPNHLTSKVGRNLNSSVSAPSSGRPKKHKVDLGPLLGLKRDWWSYSQGKQAHAHTPQVVKVTTRKQKRPRSRSVFNRNTSVNKIRRVSDIGELRRHGLLVTQDSNHEAKLSAIPATENSSTERGFQQTIITPQTVNPVKNIEHPSNCPSQSNQHSNYLPPTSSLRKPHRSDDDAAQSFRATSTDMTENKSPHPIESDVKITDTHHSSQGQDHVKLTTSQVHKSDVVFQAQASLAHEEEDTSMSAEVNHVPPVSEFQVAPSETLNVENVQSNQMEDKVALDINAQQGALGENSEAESSIVVPDQSQPQSQTATETSASAQVRLERLNHASDISQEGKLVEVVTEDQTMRELIFSPSHMHPIPNESPEKLQIGLVNNPSAQSAPSDTIEHLAERWSPEKVVAPSPPESPSLQQRKENRVLDQTALPISLQNASPVSQQDSCEINGPQSSPTSNVKPEPMLDQQIDANTQDPPSLSSIEATHSHLNVHVPISTTERSNQCFQSIGTAPVTETSSSQSNFMDVDVHPGGLIVEQETASVSDRVAHNLEERKLVNDVPSAELKPSSKVLVATLEKKSPEPMQANSPSRILSRSESVSNDSEFEAQEESVLSHPSDESEESLLDSDASTTILGSSDEEMLSSHTPRYLNNRKRIRSKNIVKPIVRMGAINKNQSLDSPRVERQTGLANTNGVKRSFKLDTRSTDKLGNPSPIALKKEAKSRNKASSISSNLDSEEEEEDVCVVSSKPVPRESGSKMRLTIRSSSPSDNDAVMETVTSRPQHRPRIMSTPSSSPVSDAGKSPQLVPVSVQPVPPVDPHSQSVNQEANVNRSDEDSHIHTKNGGSSDSHPSTWSKSNNENHVAIAHQQQGETLPTLKIPPVAIAQDGIDPERELKVMQPTARTPTPSVLESSASKNSSYTPPGRSHPVHASSEGHTNAPDNDLKNDSFSQTSAVQSVKQPPKRISLKDYRSRKGGEPVNVTPIANPLVQFSTVRPPPPTSTETSQRKQPPPLIVPALPPLLPPTQQSQPLLPLSPRKLELVASVLNKKEDKDRSLLKDSETESTLKLIGTELPSALPPPSIQSSSIPASTLVDQNKEGSVPPFGLNDAALEVNLSKEFDHSDKTCEENGNPSVADLEGAKVQSEDTDVGLLEDDIDGVAIESMSNSSEDGFEDEGKQRNGLESSKMDPLEEKNTTLMPVSPDFAIQASTSDSSVDPPPVLEEQIEQMKIDNHFDCLDTRTVELDDLPPMVSKASSDNDDVANCSPAPESTVQEDSTTLEKSAEPAQNKELDMDDSREGAIQPRVTPKPRLSLAAYRQRLAAARSSTSEEPHQSQSSSPFLPDLDLMKVTPDSSTPRPLSQQSLPPLSSKLEQPDQNDTPSQTVQTRNLIPSKSDPPLIQSLEVELEPNINNTTSTGLPEKAEAPSELRPSDATMYFPPISPSILMDAEESPHTPELKSSPPPGASSEQGHCTTPLPASLSPHSKSPRLTPLESTTDLKGDVKGGLTKQITMPRVFTDSSSKPSETDLKTLEQTTTSRHSKSLSKQSVSHQPTPSKCTSTSSHNHPKSSPGIHTSSLPLPIPSHPHIVNHARNFISSSNTGPSNSHSTSISPLPPTPRIQTPVSSSHSTPIEQPLPPPPSSRQLMSSSIQQSPTISLSPQLYNSSISPSSPASIGVTELRSSPRGSSHMIVGSSRGGYLRVSNRAPHHFNSSSAASRPSWSPEPITTSNNNISKSTVEIPAKSPSPMMNTPTGINNTTKSLAEIPTSSSSPLPMIPNHTTVGIPKHNHSNYHLPSHRTSSSFPSVRNFPDHRTTSIPIVETSGPGPPSSQFRQPPNTNGGVERARYDTLHRNQIGARTSLPYPPPNRGRAKVRGTGQPYWSVDNPSSGSNNGRNFSNGSSRNDR